MTPRPRLFLDTGAVFAAILSPTGGARLLLKLGEAGAVRMVVGPRVLAELDGIVARKAPDVRPTVALLLDAAGTEVGAPASEWHLAAARQAMSYAPHAQILAETLVAEVAFFVSLDRARFVGNPALDRLPFLVGTPGDCLVWLRRVGGPLDGST